MSSQRPNRTRAAEIARDTVSILERGVYAEPASGREVSIAAATSACVAATSSHPPDADLLAPRKRTLPTRVEVTTETTLEAGLRLHRDGSGVVALNFASAKNPGGGFLNGARAQEESLARSSALYPCLLECRVMYEHHRALGGGLYTDWALFSPDVPVFRDDAGALLASPWPCSFLTCAAVNAGVVGKDAQARIAERMRARVHRVLAVAAHHRAEALVLGAWGCGVFANDPSLVAGYFRDALSGAFENVFPRVVFAVLDLSTERRFVEPFERCFF